METLHSLRQKIDSAEELHAIVRTMKSLAAVHIRQSEQAVEALGRFSETIEWGLHVTLHRTAQAIEFVEPINIQPLGALVIGTNQGLVGGLNQHVARHAVDELQRLQPDPDQRTVITVGFRISDRVERLGIDVNDTLEMANSVAGLDPLVQRLVLRIADWRAHRDIERIVVLYAHPVSEQPYEPRLLHILPIDPLWLREVQQREWPTRVIPQYAMDWHNLFSALIQGYLLTALYRALADSLASENASRLRSMQAAEDNIEAHLDKLNAEYRDLRKTSITESLLDIVAGYEAVMEADSS